MRAALILTPPEIPDERSFVGFVGTPEAIAAARKGAYWYVDELELAWLNAWGPKPAIEGVFSDDGKELAPRAMFIRRGAGPRCETLVEWALVRPCGRCWRRVRANPRCRYCGGAFHADDAWESVYADLDGNLVEVK